MKEALGDTQLTSALAGQGKLADLTLPNTACFLDEHDTLFLDGCRLSAPLDVTKPMQTYPLHTVIKIIKLFLNIPNEHEVCRRLKFDHVNHLCPVRNMGLFDLIALVTRLVLYVFFFVFDADEMDVSRVTGLAQMSYRS